MINDKIVFLTGLILGIFLGFNALLFWDRVAVIDNNPDYGDIIHKNGIYYKLEPFDYILRSHGQAPKKFTKEGKISIIHEN